MIVGQCTKPAAEYSAAERQDTAVPQGSSASGDAVSTHAIVPQQKFHSRAAIVSTRPDASFVAHLIATAEQVPQTRALRRASIAEAMSYYDAVTKVSSSASGIRATGLSRVT